MFKIIVRGGKEELRVINPNSDNYLKKILLNMFLFTINY